MYSYVSCKARPKEEGSSWELPELTSVVCKNIFKTYRKVYVVLSHPVLTDSVTLDLDDVRSTLDFSSLTFGAWLTSIGDASLPTTKGTPSIIEGSLRTGIAWSANYQIIPTDHVVHPDTELSLEQQKDLLLVRADTNYSDLYKYAMVSVNGFFHQTEYSDRGLYVLDGGTSATKMKNNRVGITSFQDIGGLEFFPIKEEYFVQPVRNLKYKDRVYLKLPASAYGKTVGLVLGGFFHLLDGVVEKVSDSVISIRMNRLQWPEQFELMRDNLVLDNLPIESYEGGRVVTEQLFSDELIKYILKLSQSFVFYVDHDGLSRTTRKLESTKLPGRYISAGYPKGMLLTGPGRTPEYTTFVQGGKNLLATEAIYRDLPMRDTFRWKGQTATSFAKQPDTTSIVADAFLLAYTATSIEIK